MASRIRDHRRVPPAEPLSPELILISPPEVSQVARELLPEPGSFGRPTGLAAPRRESRLRRLLVLAAVYAGCLLLTVPPLAFVAFASPSLSR
jgi:hypothetical protein